MLNLVELGCITASLHIREFVSCRHYSLSSSLFVSFSFLLISRARTPPTSGAIDTHMLHNKLRICTQIYLLGVSRNVFMNVKADLRNPGLGEP